MSKAYFSHNTVRLSCAFTVNGVATDPTTVTLNVQDPAGVVTSYTYAGAQIAKDSVGNYHYDLNVVTQGAWLYEFIGTGTCIAASEGSFTVSLSVFA